VLARIVRVIHIAAFEAPPLPQPELYVGSAAPDAELFVPQSAAAEFNHGY